MNFYVYLIHNTVNNKVYVGKTMNPKRRWLGHLSFAKHHTGNQYIHKAMRKYGFGSFTFSVIQELPSESEYNEAEKYWIGYFNSNNHLCGYNLTCGGEGSLGRKQTAATRKKISDAKINTMTGALNPFYGQKHTSDTRKLISAKNKGLKRTDYFKKERSRITSGERNPFYGKQHSAESLSKMSSNAYGSKINAQQVSEIISMYDNGIYQSKIALTFGISKSQVGRIVRRERWKSLSLDICSDVIHGSKINMKQASEIISMYNNGIYQKKIASDFGISQQQVSRIVNGKRWKCLNLEAT